MCVCVWVIQQLIRSHSLTYEILYECTFIFNSTVSVRNNDSQEVHAYFHRHARTVSGYFPIAIFVVCCTATSSRSTRFYTSE